jgi:outer membrane autotransporter protein
VAGRVNGINTNTGGATIITNNAGGVISSTNGGATPGAIRVNTATIANFGTVTGDLGINFRNGNGPSTIFNAGTITGSGGTAIHFSTGSVGNTLTLAPGFAINGTVAGAGTDIFQLGGTGSATFNVGNIGAGQQYQGFSTFNKIDTSTWTLTGSGNSIWNVQGGVLAGNATIGGLNVASGGTVTPGNFGTLNVNGNVSFAAGSFFGVNLNAAGQNDRIAATGTATLAGGTVQALAQLGNFAPSTAYTILTAGGGVSGTFANVTSNSAFLAPTLSYTPTSVLLTMIRTATLSSQAQTPNQLSVAAALDRSSLASPLVVAVLNQTAAGARQAFDALSGEIYGSVQTGLLNDSYLLRNELLGRLRQGAYAGAPADLGALAFGGPDLITSEAASAYARKDNFPIKAPAAVPNGTRDLTWWAQGLGAWGRVDSDGNAAALSNNTAGVISGIDARFGQALRAGLAAGYTHSWLNVDARASSAGIDSAHVGAYAGANLGPFSLRSGATYSLHTIDTTRNVIFPGFFDQTTAHFHGDTAQVFGEMGHGVALGPLAVEPFAGLAYVHLRTGGFLETGGLAALSGTSNTENVGYSSLGARAASVVMLANGTALVPRASVAWQHAFSDVTPTAGLAFQSTGVAFSVAGVPIARDSALVEAGTDLRFSPNAKVGIAYTGALAAHAQTHAVKGGFTWNF